MNEWPYSGIGNCCAHEHWGSMSAFGPAPEGFRADLDPGATPTRPVALADVILDPYLAGNVASAGPAPDTVAREWGLDDAALPLLRRLPVDTPPRSAGCDDAVLRAVASCANECGDAMLLDGPARQAALRRVAQRYARVLRLTLRDLEQALGLTPAATRNPGAGAAGEPGEPEEPGRGAQMREG